MTLPVSGPISLNNVNVELGLSGTATIGMNDSAVRTLFGVSSGAISMSDGYGKSNAFSFTISSNQTNANLRTLAVAAGWNQASAVVATINAGVIISSNSTGTPALTVSGSFPGGVSLTNNGTIVGMGGNGGAGAGNWPSGAGSAGGAGGTALSVSTALSVVNNGTVAGGGGGGGGGASGSLNLGCCGYIRLGGGGGGGGRSSNAANSSGGAGGAGGIPGNAGGSGTYSTAASGGAGGYWNSNNIGGAGGAGGGWGTAGSTGGNYGPLPSCGYPQIGPYSGGGAGSCTSGGVNITWTTAGTRVGPLN